MREFLGEGPRYQKGWEGRPEDGGGMCLRTLVCTTLRYNSSAAMVCRSGEFIYFVTQSASSVPSPLHFLKYFMSVNCNWLWSFWVQNFFVEARCVPQLGLFLWLSSTSQRSSLHNKPLPNFCANKKYTCIPRQLLLLMFLLLSHWQCSRVFSRGGPETQIGTDSYPAAGQQSGPSTSAQCSLTADVFWFTDELF
jgi:hypothetical protein